MKTSRLGISLLALLVSTALAWGQTPSGPFPTVGDSAAYNATPKTCTDGKFCYLQTDVNGNLLISGTISTTVTFPTIGAAVPATGIYNALNVAGVLRGMTGLSLGSTFSPTVAIVDASGNQVTSFGGNSNITQWNTVALGSPSAYGTSPGAVNVPGVNAFVTNTNANGRATPANSSPVVLPAYKYIAVAASQTATALVGAGSGAAGDYLSHCVIYPTATTTGVVTVFDNTNTAPNSAILFAGGASSTSNLTPISVPVGAVSVNGAWKVTTGTAVSVVCYGNFT